MISAGLVTGGGVTPPMPIPVPHILVPTTPFPMGGMTTPIPVQAPFPPSYVIPYRPTTVPRPSPAAEGAASP